MSPRAVKHAKKIRREKLATKTVQIIGFGFAISLTIFKLYSPESDIPWWVVFGFFGFGSSADMSFLKGVIKK